MTRITLVHVGITGSLLGAVTYLFVQSTSVDPAEHVRVLQVINNLNAIDSELRRKILLIRSGLLLHYDSVNQQVAGLHRELEALHSNGAHATRAFSDEVKSRFEAVAANVGQEEELVERFKSNHALVRNSWAYFTQRSQTVSKLSAAAPVSDEFNATFGSLLPTMLHVLRSPGSQATEVAAKLLDQLNRVAVPDSLRSHIESLVIHGRLILELSPDLDVAVKQFLSLGTAAQVEALRAAYLEYHHHIEDRAETHRILLYAVSLLLFIYLGYLFFRIGSGARALAQLNEGLLEEISERKQAEERTRELQTELAHAHRLSLMGEMASGLAHELNQPLTAIRLYAKGCARRFRSGEASRDELLDAMDRLSAEVLRAGEIVSWIRGFVGKKKPQTAAHDVNALVREAVDLLSYELRGQGIAVELDLSNPLPRVEANKIEVQQILLNLARNSMEAMTENGCADRSMTIRTSRAGPDSVEIVVRDTGPGIPSGMLDHVCDSFVTTKAHGLGLGLSICRSMVEAHGGRLWATSEVGTGASFHFTLPIVQQERRDDASVDNLCHR